MDGNDTFFLFTKENFWLIEIGIVFIILLTMHFLFKFLLRLIRKRAKTQDDWRHRINYIVFTPLKFLIWLVGIFYIAAIVSKRFEISNVEKWIFPIRNSLIILCVMWLLLRWKNEILKTLLLHTQGKKKQLDATFFDFLSKILSITIIFLALLLILPILGLNIMPLIAFGGIGAAAIGFAAKDVIANFFGGIVIHITRPFSKKDLINLPDKKLLATVESIGWYYTLLRDMDKCPVYLPNIVFSSSLIFNLSRRSHRKIEETISIRYQDFAKLRKIVDQIQSYISQVSALDQSIPPFVYFTNFGASSLNIICRAYTTELNYEKFLAIKQEILINIKNIIDHNNADIPFATTTVKLEK